MSKQNIETYERSKVTIYIPCFGYHNFILTALESLKKQKYDNYFCLIFILKNDNQSKEIILPAINGDPRFSIKELDQKPSMQTLGNIVLNNCTTEYILRLDADDRLDDYGLEILINSADKDNMIAMLWGCFYYCSQDGEIYDISPYKTILSDRKTPPHGACTLLRTSALRSISGYDETIQSQDGFDIWQRLKSIYKVQSIPQVIFYYTQHKNSLSKSKERINLSSDLLNQRKNKALSGSLKINFLIVIGIKEFFNSELKQNFLVELEKNKNGKNKIIEIINLVNSIEIETNLVVSTTSQRMLEYCNELKKEHSFLLVSDRKVDSNHSVPIINILRDGLNAYMKEKSNIPSMLIFLNTHSKLPTAKQINDSWLKLTCSSDSIFMPVENIRELILIKKSQEFEILNPGRFKDIYPAHEKLYKWEENFLCCTPDSILQDFLFNSISSI
tara:strand:- start:43789 stop:45123 length:1335 start_codon:yes stop_codon:yes gene_type:complete